MGLAGDAPGGVGCGIVRIDARNIDVGVRDVVAILNRIAGVTTRASCEGSGSQPARHRHAELAYVLLRYPMPVQFQDFLVARIGALARIEDDGIYSRWPTRNRLFLESLESAARAYLSDTAAGHHHRIRWPLPKLRAHLARPVTRGHEVRVGLCLVCADLVLDAHPPTHQPIALLCLTPDQRDRWFADFVAQPGNALDPALVAADGWVRLTARTERGDFGAAFHYRWLRYRARMIASLSTRALRSGVAEVRRHGIDIDFFHTDSYAVFTWNPTCERAAACTALPLR